MKSMAIPQHSMVVPYKEHLSGLTKYYSSFTRENGIFYFFGTDLFH